jgi:hypothetical protein
MAAGLGFKTFATGDILTAADANGYLMSQTVMVFADSAARSSAITSPQEGMITYLKDTNSTEYYSGSAWVALSAGSSGSYTQIATGTLSSTGATLSSIPTTYKKLVLQLDNLQVNAIVGLRVGVNSNTSAIYDSLNAEGRSGAIRTAYGTGETSIEYTYYRPVTGNNGNVYTMEFPNYASTTAYKVITINGEGNCADGSGTGAGLPVILASTFAARTLSAITTINLTLSSSTYAGGTYTLWGVN